MMEEQEKEIPFDSDDEIPFFSGREERVEVKSERHFSKPFLLSDDRFFELEHEEEPGPVPGEDSFPFTFICDILNAPPVEWLIENILFDRTFSLLTSYAGAGKSLLALTIAQSIADGSPLFGRYTVNRTGKVLICDEENAHSDLRDRIIRMGISKDLPIYFLSFLGIKLDSLNAFRKLFSIITELDPVLVIFDSLVRFHTQNENDASEMSAVMTQFRKITNEGIGCLILHHHGKGTGALEVRTRGSSDIVGAVDVEYSLVRKGEGLVLSTVKSRRATIDPINLSIKSTPETLRIVCTGTAKDERGMIELVIDDFLKDTAADLSEIWEMLSNSGYDISQKRLRYLLREMVNKKYLKLAIGLRNRKVYSSLEGCQTETAKLPN